MTNYQAYVSIAVVNNNGHSTAEHQPKSRQPRKLPILRLLVPQVAENYERKRKEVDAEKARVEESRKAQREAYEALGPKRHVVDSAMNAIKYTYADVYGSRRSKHLDGIGRIPLVGSKYSDALYCWTSSIGGFMKANLKDLQIQRRSEKDPNRLRLGEMTSEWQVIAAPLILASTLLGVNKKNRWLEWPQNNVLSGLSTPRFGFAVGFENGEIAKNESGDPDVFLVGSDSHAKPVVAHRLDDEFFSDLTDYDIKVLELAASRSEWVSMMASRDESQIGDSGL